MRNVLCRERASRNRTNHHRIGFKRKDDQGRPIAAGADGNAMLKMALRVWQREKRNGTPRSIPNSAGHQVSEGDRRPRGGRNTSAAHGAVVSDDGHTRVHCNGGVGDRLLFQLSRSAGIFNAPARHHIPGMGRHSITSTRSPGKIVKCGCPTKSFAASS